MKRAWFVLAMLSAIAVAAAFRLPQLDRRPMHCDEAVQAGKFGRLLEKGEYVYNPREYHGPTLYYCTLPIAWLTGTATLAETTEFHLRLLTALAGIALVAATWLLGDRIGRAAAAWAALLCAVSPAMVFYSRYYIQEMLLVAFTLLAIAALLRAMPGDDAQPHTSPKRKRGSRDDSPSLALRASMAVGPGVTRAGLRTSSWLLLLGVSLGLMHATKETFVIPAAAMAVSAAVAFPQWRRAGRARLACAATVVVLSAAAVSVAFHTSFFAHKQGAVDSLATYAINLQRAFGGAGGGESGLGGQGGHRHSPLYYFHLLLEWRVEGGAFWSEGAIAALALYGALAAAAGGVAPQHRRAAAFLAGFTVLTAVAYSIIPYKTPWCALGFWHGAILLAGVGAAALWDAATKPWLRALYAALLCAAVVHLGWQACRASFVACADPTNPYVYAHTTDDVLELSRRVHAVARAHPQGLAMPVQAICPADDYWPLPWYLRDMPAAAWYKEIPGPGPGPGYGPNYGPNYESARLPAPVVITQPSMEDEVAEWVMTSQPPGERSLYVPLRPDPPQSDWFLRPMLPLRAFVRFDLEGASHE